MFFFDMHRADSAPSLYDLTPGFDLCFNGNKYILYIDDAKYHTQSAFQQIFFGLITDFYEFVFLMDYLVENQYIALADKNQSPSSSHQRYTATSFLSGELQDKLTKYFSCYFYPTNKLYDMVDHNYLDLEGQQKFKQEEKQQQLEEKQQRLEAKQNKQFNITTFIAVISLLSSIATIIVPIINDKNNKNKIHKIEFVLSNDSINTLPVSIVSKESLPIEVSNVIHIEENNQQKIPFDVNVNINYPQTKKEQ